MTTELEQEFYDTFGIEPKHNKKSCKHCKYHTESNFYDGCIRDINFINCPNAKKFYSKITDHKLLQMICIVMKYKNTYRFVNGIEDLKEQTLKILISLKDMLSIYAEIQQLFKD